MDDKNKNDGSQLRKYAILTGIAFQMGGIIFLFAYIGQKIDEYYSFEQQWVTIVFVIAGVAISLYLVLKQLNKINKSN